MSALDLPDRPWIIGHRGAAGEEPENTLAGVDRALTAGADMVEVDLQLTADGQLVLFHDETLERLIGERRSVEALTWKQLKQHRLRAPGRRDTHRIARLRDLLAAVPDETALNLEAKVFKASRRAFATRLVAELGARRQVLVSSFDWPLLSRLRQLAPDRPLAPISHSDRAGLLTVGAELSAWSLHCHHSLATRRLLDSPLRAGRPVLAYTVNQPRRARELLRRGARGIFTDHPTALIESLTRWPV